MLENEIKELIEKQLPATSGRVIRERLERLEQCEKELESMTHKFEYEYERKADIIHELEKHEELSKRQEEANAVLEEIKLKSEELAQREQRLEVALLKQELACAQYINEKLSEFMLNLSKNTTVRRSFTKDVITPCAVAVDNNNYPHYGGCERSTVNEHMQIQED